MIAWIKLYWTLAKDKVTVWLGVLIGSAEAIRGAFPGIVEYLPEWARMHHVENWLLAGLGFLVCYTRVRRLLAQVRQENA